MTAGTRNLALIAAAVLAALLYWKHEPITGAIMSTLGPRGIRNNNPGNLRKNGISWQGLAPADQQTDPAFYVFSLPDYGVRAMARVLRTYYNSHGLRSIREIITRYAPATENNTNAYTLAVAREVGMDPDYRILDLDAVLPRLVPAMIRHENGMQPYAAADLARWINLV